MQKEFSSTVSDFIVHARPTVSSFDRRRSADDNRRKNLLLIGHTNFFFLSAKMVRISDEACHNGLDRWRKGTSFENEPLPSCQQFLGFSEYALRVQEVAMLQKKGKFAKIIVGRGHRHSETVSYFALA